MSRRKGRALSAVLAACLMLCQPVYAFAVPTEEPVLQPPDQHSELDVEEPQNLEQGDTVFNEDELAEWMQQHSKTGGTVFLGERVTITQPIGIYNNQEIIIDTGEYGFVFDGAALPAGNVQITGEGVEMPVVDVLRVGSGFFWENSWNNTLLELSITATGRGGKGGVALRILAADTKSFSMGILSQQGVIRSYGEGAVGLWLALPMEAWCYKVEVFGENSMAVYAPDGAGLYYCKLSAEGEGAVPASGGDLRLESCVASPFPSGVQNIKRRAMEESFTRLYLPLEKNTYNPSAIEMLNTPAVFLRDEAGSVTSLPFAVYWDIEAYDSIDTSILGKTMISGTVAPPLYGLGVFDDVTIELTVEVREPDLPCISRIAVRELDGNRYAVLNFWQDYDPTEEGVILWRSDDEGQTWQDATHASDITWKGDCVNFAYATQMSHPVWFQLEAVGAGESNIVVLDERDGVFVGGNGGDRTGTDRGGVNPPVSANPPVSINPPSGGENGTGGDQPANGNTPGIDEGANDGGSKAGNGNIPATDAKPSDSDAVKSGSHVDDELEADSVAVIPSISPPDREAEDIPAENPAVAAFTKTASAKEKPQAVEGLSTVTEEEHVGIQETDEEATVTEAAALFAPEQSAPEPGFSANTLTIFFLGVAGLCSGALLVLRLGRNRR